MPENEKTGNSNQGFNDNFCVLTAERALNDFIQVKILEQFAQEETDPIQKEALNKILTEEKQEFEKSKNELNKCLTINSNPKDKED